MKKGYHVFNNVSQQGCIDMVVVNDKNKTINEVLENELTSWADNTGYSIKDEKGYISNFTPIWEKGSYTRYLQVFLF